MTLFRDSKNKTKFVPIRAKSVWDKNDDHDHNFLELERCPNHDNGQETDHPTLKDNPTTPIKWEDIIGDFPEIKADDVVDIYVYKNGVLIWPKK